MRRAPNTGGLFVALALAGCAQEPAPKVAAQSTARDSAAAAPNERTLVGAASSLQLGGMRLGMTQEDFAGTCGRVRGSVLPVGTIDLACTIAPSPLTVAGGVTLRGNIVGKFCGPEGTLCETAYIVDGDEAQRDQQIETVLELLVARHGPPTISEGHAGSSAGAMARCRADRSFYWMRGWRFGHQGTTSQHPLRSARLVFSCDLRGRGRDFGHYLTVFYDDESGLRLRAFESVL
jgi:hypothetical protein